ncbi:MAG TPA: diaminopimelate epimerase [Ignavibacteriales bacterium]|nr:diaminopimelate epimerase [Ignavibacteriales bacterium]
MKKITFIKITGAGNDFVLFDMKFNPDLRLTKEAIVKLCDRRYGIGGDGVITIKDIEGADFEMTYYNSDGSSGFLCGNGARCAIRSAYVSGRLNEGKADFINCGKRYKGEILDPDNVRFYMLPPENIKLNFKIKASGQLINASYANTGARHVVVNIADVLQDPMDISSAWKDIKEFPAYQLGREIRHNKDFAPEGCNVNFISIIDNTIYIRTYEKGVEDETFACGTGSAASAICAHLNYGIKSPVSLITKGEDRLTVDFNYESGSFSGLALSGPAYITYSGEFYSNMYF